MADVDEECFPRGPAPKTPHQEKRRPIERPERLFRESHIDKDDEKQQDKRKYEKQTEESEEISWAERQLMEDDDLLLKKNHISHLSFKHMEEGMNILGCIKVIKSQALIVSLPNSIIGSVKANHISSTYTNALQKELQSEEKETAPSLDELFQVGDLVICSVIAVNPLTKHIDLSIEPHVVNTNCQIAKLKPGMLISCCVKSLEDHGYTVDVGKKRVNAFIPIANSDSHISLKPFQVLRCAVVSIKGDGKILTLSNEARKLHKPLSNVEDGTSLDSILPGTLVKFTPTEDLHGGQIGKIFNSFDASVSTINAISSDHRRSVKQDKKKENETSAEKPKNKKRKDGSEDTITEVATAKTLKKNRQDDSLIACVLYVSIAKTVVLTTNPKVWIREGRINNFLKLKEDYPVGFKCKVRIIEKMKGIGILCQLQKKGPRGIIYLRNVSDTAIQNNFGDFPDVKQMNARVIENLSLDGVVELSSKKSVYNAAFLRCEDVECGKIVQAKIRSVDTEDNGAGLKVVLGSYHDNQFLPCPRIRALVPAIHMSDIILKNPEKRFNEGDILTCRVLCVSLEKQKVLLTNKPSLVHCEQPVITRYDQMKAGDIIIGTIFSIKEFGIFIRMFNDVTGFVPKRELGLHSVEAMEREYFVGEVKKCRVMFCEPEGERLILSFRIKVTEKNERKKMLKSDQLVDVQLAEKTDHGFTVVIVSSSSTKSRTNGFLPAAHLSDFLVLARAKFSLYKVGMVLKECVVTSFFPLMVTKKESFVDYVKEREEEYFRLQAQDLEPNTTLPGFVRKVDEFGAVVEIPDGLVGYCHKNFLSEKFIQSAKDYYTEGQSVVAVIAERDEEKQRFSVKLKPSEVSRGADDRILKYCQEANKLRESLSKEISLRAGDVVTVTSVVLDDDKNRKCVIEGVNARKFTGSFVGDDEPAKGPAVVLAVDLYSRRIVLTNQEVVLAYAQSNKNMLISLYSTVHCTVLYVDDDLTVGHVTSGRGQNGRLVYLATLPHCNHPSDPTKRIYCVGQNVEVKVCHITPSGLLLGGRRGTALRRKRVRQDSERSTSSTLSEVAHEFGDLKVGEQVEVTVRSIKPTSVVVSIPSRTGVDGHPLTGRIHACEMEEEPEHNALPMRSLKIGQTLSCHVIGCRDVRTHKFLEITNRRALRGVVELSLRRSVPDQSDEADLSHDKYPTGREIISFVRSYDKAKRCFLVEISPSLKTHISELLISGEPQYKVRPTKFIGKALHCVVLHHQDKDPVLSAKGAVVDCETGDDLVALKPGCVLNGEVQTVLKDGIVVKTALGQGKAHLTDLFDKLVDDPLSYFKVGQGVRCRVLECDNSYRMTLSLKESLVRVGSAESRDDHLITANDLNEKQLVQGHVKMCGTKGVWIWLSRKLTGRVMLRNVSNIVFSMKSACEVFHPGKAVTCSVLSVDPRGGRVELSMLEKDVGSELAVVVRKRSLNEDSDQVSPKKKRKVQKSSKDTVQRIITEAMAEEDDIKVDHASDDDDVADEPGFVWDDTDDVKASDDESAEDSGIEEIQPKAKLTKREKAELLDREEESLRKRELELLDDKRAPSNADDWERLLTSNPDNSMYWVRYMAFHLHATEIEKARSVAEKALKTINFREENEKLNVWVALLNLESLYGSDVTMDAALARALEQNDQLKVLNHVISIYTKTGKNDKVEQIHKKLVKRFREDKEVWLAYMRHLLVEGKPQEAQTLMKRAVKSLDNKQHLEVVSKFAKMEFELGDAERGRTIFESAISSYPKRTDVWSMYIDTLLKAKRIEDAREIFNRVTSISISSKKMRSFLKRLIDFETKYGNDVTVSQAKQKAMNYVETKRPMGD